MGKQVPFKEKKWQHYLTKFFLLICMQSAMKQNVDLRTPPP